MMSCENCESERICRESNNLYSIRKPLVPIIILVIFAMCLEPTEALSRHRRRHEQMNNANSSVTFFRERLKRIELMLKVTLAKYETFLKELDIQPHERRNRPLWIPVVDFQEIYRKNHGGPYKRFSELVPRLYVHMLWYQKLFDLQHNVHISVFSEYDLSNRRYLINQQQKNLSSLIKHLHVSMQKALNMTSTQGTSIIKTTTKQTPSSTVIQSTKMTNMTFLMNYKIEEKRSQKFFRDFQHRLDETGREILDMTVAKHYIKDLRNWIYEMKCGRKRGVGLPMFCVKRIEKNQRRARNQQKIGVSRVTRSNVIL